MQIAHLDAVIAEEFSELFRHALGQRSHQHALVFLDAGIGLGHQVIDLAQGRPHLDGRVDQTSRPHHLLHHLAGMLVFIIGRRRRHENRLPHLAFEFIETQRPVIQRRRQPETIIHQIGFTRAVAVVHAVQLADQHMRFIQEHQRIRRQVIDQGRRRLAWQGAAQMA